MLTRSLVYAVLLAGSAFSLLPLIWLLRSAFVDMGQIFEMPPVWIPSPIRISNFSDALKTLPFGKYFINTFIIVILTVAGVVITCSISVYSFVRMKWRDRDLMFALLLSSMMLPYAVTHIPSFIGWSKSGLTNTFVPLIADRRWPGYLFGLLE